MAMLWRLWPLGRVEELYRARLENYMSESDRAAGGRGGAAGRGGRGRGLRNRGGRGGFHQQRRGYVSKHTELKNDVFEEGRAENAAQFVKSKRAIIDYIRRSSDKEAMAIAQAINDEAIPAITAPPRPPMIVDPNVADPNDPNNVVMIEDETEMAIWHEEVKMIAKRRQNLREGLMRTFALLWEQCSPSVQGKLKGEEGWAQVDANKDPVVLVQRMKRVCCGFEAHRQPVHALVQSMKVLTTFIQHGESNESYKERFESIWEIVEQFGGNLTDHPQLIERRAIELAAMDDPPRARGEVDADDRDLARVEIASEIKASFMLSGAQDRRFSGLKLQLENDYTL